MYSTTVILLATLGLAAAQTTTLAAGTATSTAPVSGCGTSIDLIIQNCLGTENSFLASCAANDWDCLCQGSTYVSQCYANCPSDPLAFGAQQTETSYCNAAKAYGSAASSTMVSTAAVAASTATSATASTTTTSVSASESSAEPSASSDAKAQASASASPSVLANAAAGAFMPAVGSVMAVVYAFAVLM